MTPALMRAQKVAAKSGKYKEETTETLTKQMLCELDNISKSKEKSEENIGNLLFLTAALCDKEGIDAEKSLFDKTNKFIADFKE